MGMDPVSWGWAAAALASTVYTTEESNRQARQTT